MKILHVSRFFKPSWESGGVTRVAYELSHELSKENDVTVYSGDIYRNNYHLSYHQPVDVDGIRVYYFDTLRRLSQVFFDFPYKLFAFSRNDIKNYDIIHIHEYRSIANICVSYYAHKYHIPYVVQPHGSLPNKITGQNTLTIIIKKLYDVLFGDAILKHASGILALSETEKNECVLHHVSEKNISIVSNGIDNNYLPVPERGKFRRKYNLTSDKKVVIFIGRVDPSKGISLLIESFFYLHQRNSLSRLVIVGGVSSQSYGERLTNLISHYNLENIVILTGFISAEEKKEALVDSDVFVTPSYSGFPITFLEASACQVPIVTTTNGDNLEWINGNVGFVSDNSAEAMADSIETILHNKNICEKYRINELRMINEKFNWPAISASIMEIYVNILEKERLIR